MSSSIEYLPTTQANSEKKMDHIPCLSLNVNPDTKGSLFNELWWSAIAGIIIQNAVLLLAGLMSYHDTSIRVLGNAGSPYTFPILLAGTYAVTLGSFLCTLVIEQSSVETIYTRKPEFRKSGKGLTDVRILWLQGSENVSDQNFESYAVIAKDQRNGIMTSSRKPHSELRSSDSVWIKILTTIPILGPLVPETRLEVFALRVLTEAPSKIGPNCCH